MMTCDDCGRAISLDAGYAEYGTRRFCLACDAQEGANVALLAGGPDAGPVALPRPAGRPDTPRPGGDWPMDPPTCIHAARGPCPACQAEYDEDPQAYLEYGDHPQGLANWRALQAEMAAGAAEAVPPPVPD